MTDTKAPSDATPITVNGRVSDPNEHYAQDAGGTDHIVLTLYDNITPNQHADLKALEVQFQEDLGEFTYLCRYERSSLEPLRAIKWVRQVDVYRNKFKVPAELLSLIHVLKDSPYGGDKDAVLINVVPHYEYDNAANLEELAVNVATAAGINPSDVEVLSGKVQLRVKPDQIEKIASDGYVRVIEEVLVPILNDDHANRVVFGPVQYPEAQEFHGENQVIAVIDTGFDLGTPDHCHPAFEGRIKKLISLGRSEQDLPTESQKYDDPDGHGTHVCGTIVGQRIMTPEGLVGGVAPSAELVVSSFMIDNSQQTPVKDINKVFGIPYHEHGARIFSNSWGHDAPNGFQRQYSPDAELIDAFVRDHPDALIIFSAGNNNREPPRANGQIKSTSRPTIGSQAAAKNCLTVGASGTTRVAGKDDPSGLTILHPDEVYPKSSRGRTKEDRIKPDVVAPGFSIFSAQSRHSAVKFSGFKTVNKAGPDEIAWQTRSGTSHATPLVAGCAAILREVAEKTSGSSPPAALLKAVIINGADKLPSVGTDAQGFGRVNLLASTKMLQQRPVLASETEIGFIARTNHGTLIGEALKEGAMFEMALDFDEQAHPTVLELKVTLVYNDIKGAAVQNNLNLSVIDAITGSVTRGYESEDDMRIQNNVEQVVLPLAFPSRPLKIRVIAQKIFPEKSQDFVLAWALLKPYTGFNKA